MGRRTTKKVKVKPPILVPSGSTIMNMAMSGYPHGAFQLGRMDNQIGDSSAGKTLQALTMMGVTARTPDFDDYRLIMDDTENAMSFDMVKMFGKKAAKRIEVFQMDGEQEPSVTIQEWEKRIIGICNEGPCIYCLDSFDGLSTDEEQERIRMRLADQTPPGTMGMEKAKYASACLRLICSALVKSNSYLLINSQTRMEVGGGAFSGKTRAGGKAVKFYSQHEWWIAPSYPSGKIMRERSKRKRQIGIRSTVKVTKNKLTGKAGWELNIPMYFGYGMDDIGSCIDWLTYEKWWAKTGQTIDAEDLNLKGTRDTLIKRIEKDRLEPKLQKAVAEAWVEIEKDYEIERKPRFED